MTEDLSGKELAAGIRAEVAAAAAELAAAGTPPRLAVVVATADESSAWYVRSIARAAEKAGIACSVADLGRDGDAGPDPRRAGRRSAPTPRCTASSCRPRCRPTPSSRISPRRSTPPRTSTAPTRVSLGRLAAGLPAFAPATAEAVVALLDHHGIPLAGAHAVVVGRSNVVGKPAALLLLQRDATVTVCHRHTKELAEVTRSADVLVAAVGRPNLITAEFVAEDAVVVDVGTNPTPDGGLVGDVDADSVTGRAAGLTPVPGGVGPVTTALLLQHTVASARG